MPRSPTPSTWARWAAASGRPRTAGRTWFPIADDPATGIPIGSIGAIAVAPSDPNIVYVGTGEPDIRSQHSYGIGLFKSTDAGKTWHSIGLAETRQIGQIVVDPADPNRVYVAALGHVYKANPERGVYRSTDGGAHWKKILSNAKDPGRRRRRRSRARSQTSANHLRLALGHAPSAMVGLRAVEYARRRALQIHRRRRHLASAHRRPAHRRFRRQDRHRRCAQQSQPPLRGRRRSRRCRRARPFAVAAAAGARRTKPSGGIYLSDDAGATWKLVNNEQRLWGRGWYFGQIAVDPTNPDRAYDINTATYMTLDAGKTWVPVKGAPGGDDYHQLWINPKDGNRMVLSSDQGTVVSVDGAKTWSTWYNQPTAEIYHVAADNRFPYWLYGAQQDSGGVGVSTWSRMGMLSFRNWEPTCLAGESNTVVPDPKDGNLLYGSGDQRCDQALNMPAPAGGELPAADPNDPNRRTWTLPQVFSPADEALYYSNQFVFRSRDRGKTWKKISPDLTRLNPEVPKDLDPVTAKDIDQAMTDRFGVVYTIGPSPLDAKTVWVGTDDGLIHVTRDDGANWNNVTPPAMTAWSKVSQIEAGHFDVDTAYASVDRHRLADDRPYIYRTHDGGKTWTNVVDGIPEGAFVNSVKEDTRQKGLLYAATELRVYVSFNDGDHWQPLQLNMPVTSVRDIVVHGDDLAVATYGRGFWVLDQMTALRQIAAHGNEIASANAYLFAPGETLAIHQGGQNGTPLPHEEPQELNPARRRRRLLLAEVRAQRPAQARARRCDRQGGSLPGQRHAGEASRHRSHQRSGLLDGACAAAFIRARHAPRRAQCCPTPRLRRTRDYASTPGCVPSGWHAGRETGRAAHAPHSRIAGLQPGNYTVRLTVDGQTLTQPVTIKPDPRDLPKGADASPDDDDDR